MGGSLLVLDSRSDSSSFGGRNVPFSNGTATFTNLAIDVVGTNYTLQITTHNLTTNLTGPTVCTSSPITVMVGDMAFLDLVEDPSLSSSSDSTSTTSMVTGGKAFVIQPLLHVLDAGRNLVIDNSFHNMTTTTTSTPAVCRVLATVENNPTNATLSPKGGEWALVQPNGMVQFRDLRLDKAGVGYKFRYDLYCEENNVRVETNVTTWGKKEN